MSPLYLDRDDPGQRKEGLGSGTPSRDSGLRDEPQDQWGPMAKLWRGWARGGPQPCGALASQPAGLGLSDQWETCGP